MLPGLTLIVPYYRNAAMLAQQCKEWKDYPEGIAIVVVDDGSPEPAADVLKSDRARLYRVIPDIPWNRGGARNLGAHVAQTDWLLHVDIDHILPAAAAWRMVEQFPPPPSHWYQFRRWRVGKADETRRKDAIAEDETFGEIKPHGDSYLCTRELYWRAGGYNENFSGCLGGGSPFLRELQLEGGAPRLMPADVCLHVYTRHAVADASDTTLSRDTSEYTRRRKDMQRSKTLRGTNPLRFEWERVR